MTVAVHTLTPNRTTITEEATLEKGPIGAVVMDDIKTATSIQYRIELSMVIYAHTMLMLISTELHTYSLNYIFFLYCILYHNYYNYNYFLTFTILSFRT